MQAPRALLVIALLILATAEGCSGPAPAKSAAAPSPPASRAPSGPAVASPSAAATASASAPPSLTYVAFGDSWPYGSHCHGCRPFPVLLQSGFEAVAEGRTIRFVNDVTNGGTAEELAARMQTDAGIRADLAAADIIVITIGGNDLGPAFEASAAGSCGGADKLDCFRRVRDVLRAAYDTMLSEIEEIRGPRPTAVRMVTTSNEFLADPDLVELFGRAFGPVGGAAVTKMNRDAQCEVAAAHHAICIDLGAALNGPNLTVPQDVNTQDAMQKVADAIVAPGLPELRP